MNRLTYRSQSGDYGGVKEYSNDYEEICALRNALGKYEDETERRALGCIFCETFDFAKARCEVVSDGKNIAKIVLFNGKYPKSQQFKFCPNCGRELVG